MSDPQVSVLLPTYNAKSHIDTCIESLNQQTFEDFEIIAVDDGSTDGTVEYLEDRNDVRLFVREDPEDGLPGALNYGIERACGPYIARQDADDLSYPERFARQVDALNSNPTVALVGTAVDLLSSDGSKRATRIPPAEPDFNSLLEKNRFVHGSVMFRRDTVLNVGGYNTGFKYTEDYDLWLRLATKYPVQNIQTPLYGLRVHDQSIYGAQLRTVKLYGWFARRRIRGETNLSIDDLRESGVDIVYEEMSAKERVSFHTEMAQELLRYGRPEKSKKACREGLSIAPVTPTLWALLGISFMPEQIINVVEKVYRSIHNQRTHSV
ncbi:glycosyltransferase family 2 protein [Salinibaculum salinum]|uniref:glycosyltransferase family 2 protein n=1 Tax=Salinibaculum salinum TaxID=3131996 RepID=UPI0030EC1654